jgi:hypothetical protein
MTLNERVTHLSEDRRYRYTLWRQWDRENLDYAAFIGLNPSTADETMDDPTIRRCIGFAKREGVGGLCMLNLFAFRATKPDDMKREGDPIGPDFDKHFYPCIRNARLVIAAWGANGGHNGRDRQITNWLPNIRSTGLYCLGRNASGSPKHPLYIPAIQPLVSFYH